MSVRALGKKIVTSLRGFAPRLWMRSDWDRRARENAQHFIACGHSESDEVFWASGRRDLDQLILHDVVLDSTARALEIGCGMGRILRPLYSFIVFQHIPTKKAVTWYLVEAARVLKGKGVFRFQVDGRPRPKTSPADTWPGVWYEPQELRRELARSGFSIADLWGEGTHYLWVTAIRESHPGRPDSGAVRLRRRVWRREALEALLTRMNLDPDAGVEEILSGRRSLRQMADRFLEENGRLEPEVFVRRAYEVFLGREADEDGLAFYSKEIASGIPPSSTVDCLLSSPELEDRLRPPDAG